MNRDFIRKVLKGQKQLLPKSEAKQINVPKYDELSVKVLYPKFKDDPEINQFLQDEYAKNRLPDRQYFFTVLNTVYPDYVSKMIEHANNERFSAKGEANEK